MNDLATVIEAYENQNKRTRYEGVTGVRNLEKLLSDMGYKDGNFIGSEVSIANFLSDNSGAIEALLEWIKEQDVDEWKKNLSDGLEMVEDGEHDYDEDDYCHKCGTYKDDPEAKEPCPDR